MGLYRATGCSDVQRVKMTSLLCDSVPLRKFVFLFQSTRSLCHQRKSKHTKDNADCLLTSPVFTKHLAGLKTRKNELKAGDLVAVLGASWEQPYRILRCVDFDDEQPDGKKYFRFQWLWQNDKDGWDLYEDIHRDLIGFATFLHWGLN